MKRKLGMMIGTALLSVFMGSNAFAGEPKTLCVYDPSGANGDAYLTMKDYQVAASAWGVDFTLKPYTNEKTAADDFTAGKCDAAFLTGVRARGFTKFAATVEALGATPSYDLLGEAIKLMANPKLASKMKTGDYETAMVMPMGAVYLMVRDRSWNSIEAIAGKRIATIGFDAAATHMVQLAGASMVSADISTFGGIFNNGAADICYAPATAFKPLELEKGVKAKGGIIRYPIAQLTGQVLIHSSRFTPEFAQSSRQYAADNYAKILTISTKSDKGIDAKYWIDIDDAARARYDAIFQSVRIKLRDEDKIYDKEMLGLMRRLRCKADGTRTECAQKLE